MTKTKRNPLDRHYFHVLKDTQRKARKDKRDREKTHKKKFT